METLKNLNKLWRSSASLPVTTTTCSDAAAAERVLKKEITAREYEEDVEDDEEESFFELELVMLNNTKTTSTRNKENENLGRRIVPIELDLKSKQHPHSPISILKSAPKFKVSLFRKPKDDHNSDLKPKPKTDDEKYTFNKAPTATISTLIRESISPVSKPKTQSISKTEDDSSKRFSKDVMHNYLKLKLIKPFHLKAAKRSTTNKSRPFESKDDCSVSSSPAHSLKWRSSSGGFRVVCKQLGKSRSASSMVIGSRRVESLEHDDGGIQSAILHCKRSFNSSRDDSSMHSRSSSDSREQEPNIDN